MFVLFHLTFTLLKVTVQASLYATVLLFVAKALSRFHIGGVVDRVSRKKWKFWFVVVRVIAFVLFVYSFTYWGDHGWGDSSRIPVGYGHDIRNGDGVFTYFYTADDKQRQIYHFQLKDSLLFAEQRGSGYLVFNFRSNGLQEFTSKQDYEQFASENGFPMTSDFKNFTKHYRDYWNGWRFWLLA